MPAQNAQPFVVVLKQSGFSRQGVPVASLAEASEQVRRFIEAGGFGASEWEGGQVRDVSGEQVARVSYNGRVWAMDGSEIVPPVEA